MMILLEDHILHNKIGVKRNEGATATTTEEKGERKTVSRPDHILKTGNHLFFDTCKNDVTICIFTDRDGLGWCVRMQQVLDLLIVNFNKGTLDLIHQPNNKHEA